MTDPVRPRRTNGLAPPLSGPQLSTWVFLPLLVIEFVLFASPLLPLVASILCTILLCILAVTSAYFGYLAMKIDPADPRILSQFAPDTNNGNNHCNNHDNDLEGNTDDTSPTTNKHQRTCTTNKFHNQRLTWDRNEPTKQCWICDVQVGETSMHCKFCNKCIDHFDHHCMCTYRVPQKPTHIEVEPGDRKLTSCTAKGTNMMSLVLV